MNVLKSNRIGMTLIEVLIAMVILSLGVTSLMAAMSRCLAVVRTARHYDNARALFALVEIEHPIVRAEIEEITESGNFNAYEEFEAYQWERSIQQVDPEERAGLFLVTTRIRWSQRGRDTFQETETFCYAPDADRVTKEF